MGSTQVPRKRPLNWLGRFVLLSLAFGLCVWAGRHAVIAAALPLMRVEIQQLDDTFRVDRLYAAHDAGEPVIRLEVGLAHAVTVNGRTYTPDPRGSAVSSTLVGNLLLPLVLLLAAAFAFPVRGAVDFAARLLRALVFSVLVCAAGIPIILLAGLWRLIFSAAGIEPVSALLLWNDFLQAGGGNVLALALGVAAAKLTRQHQDSGNHGSQQPAGP